MTRANGVPHSDVDDALERALEAEEERRASRAPDTEEHARYLAWQQERAERALALIDDEGLDEIRLDLRGAGPRDEADRGTSAERAVRAAVAAYELTGEMDAADLLGLQLEPARVLIEGILAAGTTVLASPPKIGKSWMCVQLSVECALGGEFLGRAVTQGDVLYLPLEDGRERTQRRIKHVLNGRKLSRGALTIRWDSPPLGDGMEALIDEWLDAHPRAAMIIVDTLGRVRTPGDGKRNAYQVDVQDVGSLQKLLSNRPVALVLVHHTKKGREDDFVSSVSGTMGIAGSADTIILVHRPRHQEIGKLEVTSRELEEAELAVRFSDAVWTAAPGALPGASAARMAVYDTVREHGPLWAVGVARLLRSERTAVQHHLTGLMEEGAIMRTAAGYVSLEPVDEATPVH